jgi:hypothetical protein
MGGSDAKNPRMLLRGQRESGKKREGVLPVHADIIQSSMARSTL